LTYGLFVLTAKDQKDNGCIANTCVQVGREPTRLAISVQQENYTREIIEKTGIFNVSVLTDDVPFETIRRFGMQTGREVDKFADFAGTQRSHNGLLYLTENTKAMFSCKVKEKVTLGSHTMFIGEVTESKVLSKGTPCTYAHYHKAIKPKF
jgi:flavin reductase (DIM6/NTAB) family NADH-FMN oxidoreductase RutF